jgi:serine-type D-Ala-D-Ala carboxypeptidase/endopeptidase (penicillin-binding protein 4)
MSDVLFKIKNCCCRYFLFLISCFFFVSCSFQKKIGLSAKENVLDITGLQTAHTGICIYEPASGKYWYNHQSNKYFVPASNTKIFSCYAGMKYLGDSLTGLTYTETNNDLFIMPAGDPTLLHPDFKQQPVISFLQHTNKNIFITVSNWKDEALGAGWSWDDYNGSYMAERSPLPVYGNVIKFVQTQTEDSAFGLATPPQVSTYTVPDINWKIKFDTSTGIKNFSVKRARDENIFTIAEGKEKYKEQEIPFVTNEIQAAVELLKDTIGKEIKTGKAPIPNSQFRVIKSQPTDSLFKPMMHRSDNFFAEQTLLMVSNKLLGTMNDDAIIDTLLKTDLGDLPQKPNWADGSGLSRFNLFSPQDFIWILNKMKKDFPWQRIAAIFPTGNEGTLRNYYIADSSFIYAKTGSLSGVIAISGYLITKKNKTLIFSVLVNNHRTTASIVRRSVEKFLQSIRDNY